MPHVLSPLTLIAILTLGVNSFAVPAVGQSEPEARQSVVERGPRKTTIAIQSGAVVRMRNGTTESLTSSDGDVGDPLVVAADPRGLTLCGTTRGLYVVSPDVTTLDPIALPLSGAVVGVLYEARPAAIGRIWVAQPRSLTCLEATRYRARVAMEADDGADWTGIRWVERIDGVPQLELLSANGTTPYAPDEGPEPRASLRSANGKPIPGEGKWIELGAGDQLSIQLDSADNPDLRYAWRRRGHHLWRDLDEPKLTLPPGRHRIDLVALDRDLRRSKPTTLQVHVANPSAFQKAPALLGLGGFLALALGWFVLHGRRRGTPLWRAVVSAGVLTVLVLQVVSGIFPHGRGWPFMGYSMYTEVWREGDVLFSPRMLCHLENGRTIDVDPRQLGYASGVAWQGLTPLVHGDDQARARALTRARKSFPRAGVVGLTIEDRRTRLTSDGPRVVAPRILTAYPQGAFRAR